MPSLDNKSRCPEWTTAFYRQETADYKHISDYVLFHILCMVLLKPDLRLLTLSRDKVADTSPTVHNVPPDYLGFCGNNRKRDGVSSLIFSTELKNGS